MGIKGLAKLIKEFTPQAVQREPDWSGYTDKVVAVDASFSLLQKLISWDQHSKTIKEETTHLVAIFYACSHLLRHGVKPVFVFDGVASNRYVNLSEEVARIFTNDQLGPSKEKKKHIGLLAEAIQAIRETKIVDTGYKNPVKEAKELLRLMGIPYLEAPEEAESQCAALVKSGKCFATVTENMDALTFGSQKIIRKLSFKAKSKVPIQEFDLTEILKGLQISYKEFVDLCILLGCDHCDKMKLDRNTTLELLQKYRCVEEVLRNIDGTVKFPFHWTTLYPTYDDARSTAHLPPSPPQRLQDIILGGPTIRCKNGYGLIKNRVTGDGPPPLSKV
ncbi:flap endonuclease 1-like [Macrosteles quadrilineatus]|uniref:flap endonuclease 1-like n=1 Tax=Macrosteles quadrilineatus TaxID=74068 RepID=UPI0023E0A5DE|nr:flap endonuclease 1-like [Macrosteles quadrilineatus]